MGASLAKLKSHQQGSQKSMSINEVQFIGDLTRDTAVRHSDGVGHVVSKLIVTCTWRDKSGEKQQKTDAFRIKSVFDLARFKNRGPKPRMVMASGKRQPHTCIIKMRPAHE
jgi:hypothetical protein